MGIVVHRSIHLPRSILHTFPATATLAGSLDSIDNCGLRTFTQSKCRTGTMQRESWDRRMSVGEAGIEMHSDLPVVHSQCSVLVHFRCLVRSLLSVGFPFPLLTKPMPGVPLPPPFVLVASSFLHLHCPTAHEVTLRINRLTRRHTHSHIGGSHRLHRLTTRAVLGA